MSVLNNPVMVSIELSLIQDVVKIIGASIHRHFTHNEIVDIQQKLMKQAQDSITSQQQEAANAVG